MLSMLMFVSLVGVMQSEALAQAAPGNGVITVSQVTYAANTNIDGFYFVELYYETGQMVIVNGQMTYQIVRSEQQSGLTTVSSLAVGPMTYYIHLKGFNELVVGRNYTWKVWNTKVNANGQRVKNEAIGTFSSGQTIAVAR